MPTGNKRVNIYSKRNVPQEGWENYFFTFLDAKINDTTRATFLSAGILDDEPIGLSSSVNDTITFDLTNADRGIDNDGHIVDLGNLASSLYEDYPFENATGDTYYFGFRYQTVPDDIENNPRLIKPQYPWYLETIGELGNPDNVTDNTTDITLEIDGILENGVDHSGRPFRVWLINPVSPVDSIGYYSGTVAYDQHKMEWMDWIDNLLMFRVMTADPTRIVFGVYYPLTTRVSLEQIAGQDCCSPES